MMKNVSLIAAGSGLAALVVLLTAQGRSDENKKPAAQDKAAQVKAADEPSKRPEDEAAIRKVSGDFLKAVEKGDAKAVAAFWTEEGEYITEDGTTIRGRADLEAAYAKALAKNKKLKVEVHIE